MDGGDVPHRDRRIWRFWPDFTPVFFSGPVAGQFFV